MKLIKCDNGHWYDGEKYAFCPHCRAKETNQDVDKWYEKDDEVRRTQLVDSDDSRRTQMVDGTDAGETQQTNEAASGEFRENTGFLNTEHHLKRCLHCFEEYDTEHFDRCPYCGYTQGTLPRVVYHLHPGTVIGGRYVIGTVVGFGGFGITYRAWDVNVKSVVAIKEYYPAGMVNRVPGESNVILYTGKGNEDYRKGMERFLDEARNTAGFSEHPNFVHVYDFFEENSTAYMVMELLRGENLEEYTKRCGGRILYEDAVRIYSFIAEAVGELHKNNIIHRDLSPDNFFICDNGEVKLMDLGAARFSNDGDEERTVILKIGLAPPEQYYKNGKQGPWTDVYALSASLYETLTGVEPEESTDRQMDDNLMPPTEIIPELPEYLDNVIMRGMALNPVYRFQSMDEFRKAILNEQEVLALNEEIRRRKTRRTLIIGAAVILIAIGVIFGMSMYRNRRQEAYLSECTVQVWIPYSDDSSDAAAQEVKIYEDMSSEFMQEYPSVTIEFTPVKTSEYADEIETALRDGKKLPALFMSSGLSDDLIDHCADIEKVFDSIDYEDCVYIEEYEEKLREKRQLPLGFEMISAYGNTVMANMGEETPKNNSIQDFLTEKSVLCVDSTDRYYDVQEALAGRYAMLIIPEKQQYAKFDALWSVNGSCGNEEKTAALRLLSFWLGENAQDVYCIQNRRALPVNVQKLTELSEINAEESEMINAFNDTELLDEGEFDRKKTELYKNDEIRDALYKTLKQDAKEQMNE